jgi:hypothetical protein
MAETRSLEVATRSGCSRAAHRVHG